MVVCKDISYTYAYSAEGLNNFSFDDSTLPEGICGLLGKNGAGKSTLIKIMAGVLTPKSGECLINSIPSQKRDVKVLQNIAVIPEEYDIPNASASDYIKSWSPFYPNFDINIFSTLLSSFDIDLTKKTGSMSLGQKKKFLIAFAIATRAKLLLLDEPTNGLDIPGKMLFKQMMGKYIFKGQRIFISTHQVKDVEGIVDSLVLVDKGKFLFSTSIKDIQDNFLITKLKSIRDSKDIIFSVPDIDGYTVLKRNNKKKNMVSGIKSKSKNVMDLEIFFTAAVTHTQKVMQILGLVPPIKEEST